MLVLGAGYLGAVLAERALSRDQRVVLADNWYATDRAQLAPLEERGARVETADIRSRTDLERLLEDRPDRVYLLAAQASRPLAERDPDYTEETNVIGTRRVAEALAASRVPTVYASSLHVYGPAPQGDVTPDRPYGPQGDLAHLSKIYGELCLALYARRAAFALTILRLGILYGPSPVEHGREESQTVVDKFRRLARAGRPLPLDDGGRTTIGVAHVDDAARIMLESTPRDGVVTANVAAEAVTVADVAALATGTPAGDTPAATFVTPFSYRHRLADYLEP